MMLIILYITFVVSGLFFSKVSACSLMIIKVSAEARLDGIEQSLLKQNLEP